MMTFAYEEAHKQFLPHIPSHGVLETVVLFLTWSIDDSTVREKKNRVLYAQPVHKPTTPIERL